MKYEERKAVSDSHYMEDMIVTISNNTVEVSDGVFFTPDGAFNMEAISFTVDTSTTDYLVYDLYLTYDGENINYDLIQTVYDSITSPEYSGDATLIHSFVTVDCVPGAEPVGVVKRIDFGVEKPNLGVGPNATIIPDDT